MATEETMLILVSAGDNHNKFYHLKLDDDGTLTKTYGRVGATGTTIVDRVGGRRSYDSTIRAKTKKGYKPTEVSGAGVATSRSGGNDKAKVREIARKTLITAGNSELERLIDLLVTKNNHEIIEASGGQMKVSEDGIITTPLGLVSKTSINNAKKLLLDIEQLRHSSRRSALLNDYLTLIPQKVPGRRGWDEHFLAQSAEVAAQRDFLKQLEESITLHDERVSAAIAADGAIGDAETEIAEKYADLFRFKVSVLEDEKEFRRIERFFESSKNAMHGSVTRSKLKRVYVLDDPDGLKRFEVKANNIGNTMELWHGTRVWNVLSILRRGLVLDTKALKTVQTNGAMYGSGSAYFSNQSSKSLRYGAGHWDGGLRHSHTFMFLTDVAMGNTHIAGRRSYSDNHIQRSGKWDSIWAKGGQSGVLNDEMIVWNADQVCLKYLCEFED